ncbi:MAG: sulfatase [Endomicrobiales bacterium]|nr:sulfatase [Endomicrobiales bacterium]
MFRDRVCPILKRFLPCGALYGIVFYSFLFFISLIWNFGFSLMGITQSDVSELIINKFWPYILYIQVKILLVYAIIGYIVGLTSDFVVRNLFRENSNPSPFSFTKEQRCEAGLRVLWIFTVFAYFLLASLKKYPQLYSEAFYDKGGILGAFQIFVTDYMGDWPLLSLKVLLILLLLSSILIWLKNNARLRVKLATVFIVLVLFVFMKDILNISHKNKGPNILILASDSLRKDMIYEREVTPNINKLIDEGVVFDSAHTSLPRTFPAMISFLTGKYPLNHGVRHMFPSKWERDHRKHSFVEMLRKQGYRTAVVSDFAGDVFSRMDIGFDKIKVPYFNFVTIINQRSLEMHLMLLPYLTNNFARTIFPELKELANNGDPFLLTGELKSTLKCLMKGEKFCCLTFFSATHFPYASPNPFYRKYALPGYRKKYKYMKPPTIYEKESFDEEDLMQIRGLYKGAVSSFDSAVGDITEFLKRKKVFDKTIIIITADHGENLYENGWSIGHGEHLRGPNVLNVPLVVRFPDGLFKKRKVEKVTRDVDVMPTIFDYLQLGIPEGIDGVSLMPLIRDENQDFGLVAFSETGIWFSDVVEAFYQEQRIMYPDITGISEIDFTYNMEVIIKDKYQDLLNIAKHRMIDDGNYRLIYIPTREGVKYELYDIKNETGYNVDVADKNPRKVRELKQVLIKLMENDSDKIGF